MFSDLIENIYNVKGGGNLSPSLGFLMYYPDITRVI